MLSELPQRNVLHLVYCCITISKYHAINKLTGGGGYSKTILHIAKEVKLQNQKRGKSFGGATHL